jgi:hypothetical protein
MEESGGRRHKKGLLCVLCISAVKGKVFLCILGVSPPLRQLAD